MNAAKAIAHRAGALYFVFMITAITREFFFPKFIVAGDAAATARNIGANEPMYRIGILTALSTLVMFVFLVAALYKLFREVDRHEALLMVLLVAVGVSLSLANLVLQFVPLILSSGAEYLSAFTPPQLDALSFVFLRMHSGGTTVASAFWGLWLFPFGILVIKSRFFPRILGVLLIVAGCAYVTFSVTSIVLPEYRQMISRILMPLYFGEVPIIFWLLFKGANVPQQEGGTSDVRPA